MNYSRQGPVQETVKKAGIKRPLIPLPSASSKKHEMVNVISSLLSVQVYVILSCVIKHFGEAVTVAQGAVKEAIIQELKSLPDDKAAEVLDFIRFLKSKWEEEELENRFDAALKEIRETARERGITEEDILAEIRAARAGT